MPRSSAVPFETMGDALDQLGVAPHRIRLNPPPGRATEADLIRLNDHSHRLYELVEGTLVEKVMGYLEGSLAPWISHLIQNFLDRNDLGNLAGADAAARLMPGLVRIPDVSFVRWDRLPTPGVIPDEPILGLAPDLAIEVLSESNSEKEMQRKLKEYFLSGVSVVWFVDPERRTVEVFDSPDRSTVLTEGQTIDGGEVLPGLAIPVDEVFLRVARPKKARKPRKSRKGGGA